MKIGIALLLIGLLVPCMAIRDVAAADSYALLVGVTKYDNLEKDLQLIGPVNDVDLMRSVLLERGFPPDKISLYADGLAGAGKPTRANILAAMDGLARKVGPGDFVYLHFAGHGSQAPVAQADRSEPDGLDEIFLPGDVGKWDGGTGMVQNAIRDNEMRSHITAIRNKGAFVWAVFDACHSGTMTRGAPSDGVRYRKVSPASLGIPQAALDRAASIRDGGTVQRSSLDEEPDALRADAGGYVGFFAVQTTEQTPERRLPAGYPDSRSQGVFTYHLAEAMNANPAATYRQLSQQVLHAYAAANERVTPLFEGTHLDSVAFGSKLGTGIRQWPLSKDRSGNVTVAAGELSRLGKGSTLAVVPTPASPDSEAVGLVEVASTRLLESDVTATTDAKGRNLDLATLPKGAYARLVSQTYDFGLTVARPPAGEGAEAVRRVLDDLKTNPPEGLTLRWVKAGDSADLRLSAEGDLIWLLPPSGEIVREGSAQSPSVAGQGSALREDLLKSLRAVSKATNLLRLSERMLTSEGGNSLIVTATVNRANWSKADGTDCPAGFAGGSEEIDLSKVPVLRHCDQLLIKAVNKGRRPLDLTVLYIDSRYGIKPFFPDREASPRIEAGASETFQADIVAFEEDGSYSTTGTERLLFIAAEAEGGATDKNFSFLAQDSLATRAVTRGGPPDDLDALLSSAGFGGPAATRGAYTGRKATTDKAAMRLLSWTLEGVK